MQELTKSVLPIFLLIGLGRMIRQLKIVDIKGMQGVKRIVTDIGLPVLVFWIFFTIDLRVECLLVIIISFGIFLPKYIEELLLRRTPWFRYRLLPYLTSGFAFGLFGRPLFLIVFGYSSVYGVYIIDIGHELFIWPLMIPFMKAELRGERLSMHTVKDIVTSPIIIGMVAGLALKLLGQREIIQTTFFLDGIYRIIEMIAAMITPLVLIVVGHGIVIEKHYIIKSLKYVFIRLAVILLIGYKAKFCCSTESSMIPFSILVFAR